MDDGAWARDSLGPCSECGRPLPVGTLRYCLHCGAEVGADRDASHPGDDRDERTIRLDRPERPGTGARTGKPAPATWSDGEYRAPSPLDDVPDLAPPFASDAWYSEAFLSNGHVVVPPAVPPTVPPAPIVLAGGVNGSGGQPHGDQGGAAEATRRWDAPGQPEPAVPGGQPATVTDLTVQRPPAPATQSWASSPGPQPGPQPEPQPEPWGQRSPRPEAWPPHADALPMEPAPQLPPGQFPQGQYPPGAFPGEPWQIAPGGDVDGETRKAPVMALVAGALALVVLTATGLWWLNSRDSDRVSAASSPSGVAASSSDPSAVADGQAPTATESAAAAPTPGSTSPSPEASGAGTELLTTLDGLLDRSTQARGQVGSTAVALQSCQVDAAKAAKVFRDAGAERKQLSSEAAGLSSSAGAAAGSGAGDAVRSFIALQDTSAQADDSLAAWADEVVAQGCSGRAPRTGNLDAANRFSAQASAAKARFVKIWNPIAAENGLDARSADQI